MFINFYLIKTKYKVNVAIITPMLPINAKTVSVFRLYPFPIRIMPVIETINIILKL